MLKEIELKYTVSNLVKLSKEKFGDNAVEYLAARLQSVTSEAQMKVLIDNLSE